MAGTGKSWNFQTRDLFYAWRVIHGAKASGKAQGMSPAMLVAALKKCDATQLRERGFELA